MNLDGINPESLLKGIYEVERLPDGFSADQANPVYDNNILSDRGLLHEPVLDKAGWREKPKWPEGREFAVCLTHDVDHVSKNSPQHEIRMGLLRARERMNSAEGGVEKSGLRESIKGLVGGGLRAGRAVVSRGNDPYHRWEDWLELEDSIGAKSTFFVFPEKTGKRHVTDSVYRYKDKISFENRETELGEVIREVNDRGWEIGLHSSWYSYNDPDQIRREKKQIEKVSGYDVVSARQHWLHYDIRKTPRAQNDAGIKYDSTLGPKGNIGFRFGTSYPWNLYDLKTDTELNLIEVPLIIQDTALFDSKYMDLDEDEAFECIKSITKEVMQVGGVLTINWHNNVGETQWKTYLQLLDYLDELDPWFATVGELGEWWRENYA